MGFAIVGAVVIAALVIFGAFTAVRAFRMNDEIKLKNKDKK
jgi:hypothetical protein